MSSFLYELGAAAYRRRKTTVAVWFAILALLGGFVALFADDFSDEFELPGAQSQEALDNLELTFPQVSGGRGQLTIVAPDGADLNDEEYKKPIEEAADKLEDFDHVDGATSPYDDIIEGSISDEGNAALLNVQYDDAEANLPDSVKTDLEKAAQDLQSELPEGTEVVAGGEIFKVTGISISWVEGIGVAIAFVVLFVTFGSFIAAGIPLVTAIVGVAIGLLLVVLTTAFATVNSTAPMLALMLGLAVGIDYALFIISRARQISRDEGLDAHESTARATATAGSAVVFAGMTVIIALVGLSIAGIPFLSVMGFGAAATVAVAVFVALTLVPAIMGFFGEKMMPKKKKKAASEDAHADAQEQQAKRAKPKKERPATRIFRTWEHIVTKVPALTVIIVVVGLGLFAIPASKLQLALPNNGGEPEGTPQRIAYDLTEEHFGPGANGPLIVTADIITSDDPLQDVDDMKEDLEKVDGVKQIAMATPNENADTAMIQVIPEYGPDDPRTEEVVEEIRDMHDYFKDTYGFETAVTGSTAVAIDVSSQLGKALLPFGSFVVGLSIVLLMMVFRSVAVPIKAALGFLLSVITAFGVVSLVFVQGYGAETIGIEQVGPVISFLPIILMGILFGLAMDYEVFLVSGMREAYAHGASARHAIEKGFLSSAGVVTAAALIMFAVFAAFVPAGEPIIKSIALGLAVGITVDAFLIRMTLGPAVMAMLGEKSWWLPKKLDAILPHFDVEGEGLAHLVEQRDWPQKNSPYLLYGENIGINGPRDTGRSARGDVGDAEGKLVSGVDVALKPGEVFAVTGPGSSALVTALSGRMAISEGELKILDWVMPEQGVHARRALPLIVMSPRDDSTAPSHRSLYRMIQNPPKLVVVDHADQPQDAQSAALLKRLIDSALQRGSAVVLGLVTADSDWMLPKNSEYTLLDLHRSSDHSPLAEAHADAHQESVHLTGETHHV
ncbi:MMPL family transporter [Brevibacterium sp. HMSC24B04]|uniref:MMPL family transporter n=1 Tax=Brevibacterium sp. HMSC24B04 TaxID=1581060 RepID=UPI0008A59B86|nr:MMPL family transporter [Brevibacterium sp. HMSC24B04]OFT93666.1 transporter [Brevibacterium sp. HMSC24B04]